MNKKIKLIATPILTTLAIASGAAPLVSMTSCSNNGKISPEAQALYDSAIQKFQNVICKTPHGSDGRKGSPKLDAIRTKIKEAVDARFPGQNRYNQDAYGNVWYDLDATPGMENAKKLIFQGHMDMVWSVAKGAHDYDPDVPAAVDPVIEKDKNGREIMHTREYLTSLGADDGIFGCIALALTERDIIPHGPLRIIFTADEEPGLLGAAELGKMDSGGDIPVIDSDYLLNFDDEVEGEMVVSCAGGYSWKYFVQDFAHDSKGQETQAIHNVDAGDKVYRLAIHGLLGGHSAGEIHHGRANAIKQLTNIFSNTSNAGYELCSIKTTTTVTNAIPTDAEFMFVPRSIPGGPSPEGIFKDKVEQAKRELKQKYPKETGAVFEFEEVTKNKPTKCIKPNVSYYLIEFIQKLLYGPITFIDEDETMVESSSNVSPVVLDLDRTGVEEDKPQFNVSIYSRAARNELLNLIEFYDDALSTYLALALDNEGGVVLKGEQISSFPPFQVKQDNKMLDVVKKANAQAGIKSFTAKIHGGIECAWWTAFNPNIHQVSIGAELADVHSPRETLYLDSFKKNCEVIKNIFAQMKDIK